MSNFNEADNSDEKTVQNIEWALSWLVVKLCLISATFGMYDEELKSVRISLVLMEVGIVKL